MTQPELLEIVACGETSRVQFKETLDNNDSIAAEIIALANTKGGMILFGVQKQSGLVYVDEMIVPDTSFADVYKDKVQEYLEKMQDDSIDLEEIDEQLCKNLNILKGASLTLGGLLFFGKRPQKTRRPLKKSVKD